MANSDVLYRHSDRFCPNALRAVRGAGTQADTLTNTNTFPHDTIRTSPDCNHALCVYRVLTCAHPGPGEKEEEGNRRLLSSYCGCVSCSHYDIPRTPEQDILKRRATFNLLVQCRWMVRRHQIIFRVGTVHRNHPAIIHHYCYYYFNKCTLTTLLLFSKVLCSCGCSL